MKRETFKITQALVTLDLSDTDDKILEFIDFLNKEIEFEKICFMHVIKKANFFSNLFSRDTSILQSQFILNEDIIKHFIDGVEAKISKNESIQIDYDVRDGKPLHEIIDQIQARQADLVVVGKKSLSESSGLLGRSLARRSGRNVLFIPKTARLQLKTILVPIDFSENSGKALQRAMELNFSLERPAKIICLHIFEMPDLSYYKINKTFEQLKEIVEADMNDAFDDFINKYVPDLGDLLSRQLVERSLLSTAGHLYDMSEEYNTDLIIMGAKGHSPIERLLLGSVVEKFIQINETIPTLIIR